MDVYFRATPWAIPLTAFAAIFLVMAARQIGERVELPRWLVIVFGTALAGFFAVTVTPSGPWQSALHSRRISAEGTHFIFPGEFMHRTEPSLNAWLCVPLGFLAVIAAIRYGKYVVPVLVIAAPVLSEGIQWLLPQLGRSAFLVADVVANWSGLTYGGLAGLAATAVMRIVPQL